jgi:hypothetical protein
VIGDEVLHQLDAGGVLEDGEVDALGADVGFGALEGDVFADDDFGDFVEERGARAHGAGGEGGVEGAAGIDVGGEAACVLEAVHLGMVDNAAMLDALVVSATDDGVIADENRANGYATGGEAFLGFFDGGLKEEVHEVKRGRELGEGAGRG